MDIYFDESGNTGQDLLNADQPAFVLASHNYSPDQIGAISGIFGTEQELHFKKLKGSEKGRQNIIHFINDEIITEQHINVVVGSKENIAIGQIVNYVMEPVFADNGIDIYQGKQNMVLNSFFSAFGTHFWDKILYKDFLTSFVEMIRIKTPESIEHFYNAVRVLYNSPKTKEKHLIAPILMSREQINDILEPIDKFSIDATISSFLVLCNLWYQKCGIRFNVIHDNSKQIEFFQDLILKVSNPDIQERKVSMGASQVTFPYQISKLSLVDSKNVQGVQIADLIASTISFMYSNTNPKQQRFVDEIQDSKLMNLTNHFSLLPIDHVGLMDVGANIDLAKFSLERLYKKYEMT